MNEFDAAARDPLLRAQLAAGEPVCHTPQPTPPVDDDDDDDDDEDDDRGSGGGNIDPGDDEGTFDDDEDDDEDTLWTRCASGGVGCRRCDRKASG